MTPMTIVSARIKGLEGLRRQIGASPGVAAAAAGAALHDITLDIAGQIRTALAASTGGVSRPGTVPDDAEGRLAEAVTVEQAGPGEAKITVGLPYARWLEFGTIHMAARPFLRPAALQAAGAVRARLAAAIRSALTRAREAGS